VKILITSGKGGVGKSTLTAMLGRILALSGEKVLIIDFDIALRTQDLMLGVAEKVVYDWFDVLAARCKPEDAILSVAEGGPDLLAAPLYPQRVTKEQVLALLAQYETQYDYILTDSPAGVGSGFTASSWGMDLALVVSTPDPICVHSAAVAVDLLKEEGLPCRLLINRFQKKSVERERALNIDNTIDAVGARLIGVVPEDVQLALAAQNGAQVDLRRKSAKALKRISARLQGETVPLKL
jgi:septum site-determining protein MinD